MGLARFEPCCPGTRRTAMSHVVSERSELDFHPICGLLHVRFVEEENSMRTEPKVRS